MACTVSEGKAGMNEMRFTGWIKLLSLMIMSLHTISSQSEPGQNRSSIWDSASGDTLPDNQLLYNGRVWQNLYPGVRDYQFLFTKEFLSGSVTMRGKTFHNIMLRYDIFKDELLTLGDPGGVLQLNKEMVDSFTLVHEDEILRFIKLPGDNPDGPAGYCNILYGGKHPLYVKYIKKIGKLADEGKYDKFYQITRLYVADNNIFYPVSGRKDLENLFRKNKTDIRNFLRNTKLRISKEVPEGFAYVLRYLDNLK